MLQRYLVWIQVCLGPVGLALVLGSLSESDFVRTLMERSLRLLAGSFFHVDHVFVHLLVVVGVVNYYIPSSYGVGEPRAEFRVVKYGHLVLFCLLDALGLGACPLSKVLLLIFLDDAIGNGHSILCPVHILFLFSCLITEAMVFKGLGIGFETHGMLKRLGFRLLGLHCHVHLLLVALPKRPIGSGPHLLLLERQSCFLGLAFNLLDLLIQLTLLLIICLEVV